MVSSALFRQKKGLGVHCRLFNTFIEFYTVPRPEEILVASNYTQVPVSCSEVTEVMLLGGETCMSVFSKWSF